MTEPTPITILHVSDLQFGHKHQFGRLALGDPDAAFDTLLARLTPVFAHCLTGAAGVE